MELGLVAGVVLIGFIHGVLPDHGWPIAAMYALNRKRRLLYGFVAALILGIGHLISSVVLVLAYYWFSAFAEFAEGPWLRYVAGTLLILLGIHEYRHGGHGMHDHDDHDHDDHDHDDHDHEHHGHDHDDHGDRGSHERYEQDHGHDSSAVATNGSGHHQEDDHADHAEHAHAGHGHAHADHEYAHAGHEHAHADHEHEDHGHADHEHEDASLLSRVRSALPGGGGHQHLSEEHAERGLAALGTTALLLGFAHEEPIQILAICVGTEFCLELMLIYSVAVIVAIVLPTMLLIVGYEHHRERIERYTPYLPALTAVVLVAMGLAFITGLV